jgi:5'-nucleotidase
VHLAVTGMLDELPDMVVSGINHGANMGDDTIYSGTVAAATEGFLLGVPAIAISLVAKGAFDFSGGAGGPRAGGALPARPGAPADPPQRQCARPALRPDQGHPRDPPRQAPQGRADRQVVTPRNETVYWVGAAGAAQDAGEGTDFHAVANGYVR